MSTEHISTKLAKFATGLTTNHLPPEVLENAKLRILDTVGVCLASAGMPYAEAILAYALEQQGQPQSTLFGRTEKLPPALAVLYNASLAHGNDYDDTHSLSIVHPGGVIVPTALAIAEKTNCSGKAVLASVVAGYEVTTRIGMAASKGFHAQGFHPTGVCGAFAAAITSSALLKLTEQQTVHALGIVGSQASGSLEFLSDGAWTKRLHPGWAAHAGVTAAALAQHGFTGPSHVLDGRYGLYALYATRTEPNLALITATLMQEWEILNTDFKPYPCGHISHPYMDCALKLRQDYALDPNDIVSIELRVPSAAVPILCEPLADKRRPNSGYAARFSLPFSTALLFAYGRAEIDDFSHERITDPLIWQLCDRTTFTIDDSLPFPETFPGWVLITLRDGRHLEARLEASRGSKEYPMSETELRKKFTANVQRALPVTRADKIWKTGMQLEQLADIRAFTALLAE